MYISYASLASQACSELGTVQPQPVLIISGKFGTTLCFVNCVQLNLSAVQCVHSTASLKNLSPWAGPYET